MISVERLPRMKEPILFRKIIEIQQRLRLSMGEKEGDQLTLYLCRAFILTR